MHQIKVIELRNIIRMRGAAIMRKTMCLCYFICVLTRVPATRKKRRGMRRLCFCCDVPHHGSDDPKQSTKIFKNKKKKCVFLGSEQTRTNGSNMCSRVESVREKNVKQIFVLYPETLDVLLPRFRKIRKKEYKNV